MTLVQDNSVPAINTALLSIKRDISASTTTTAGTTAGLEPGKTYNINISGNAETATTAKTARTATNANHAETAETATKMSNALTVNGKTYNGSEAVDAGVQTIANGGTGVTTQADINKAFIGNLGDGASDVTDGTEFVSSYASNNGFSEPGYVNTPLRRKFSAVWGYIKGKISSVLGLTATNYGGKASTAGTADVLANGSGKLKFFYTYCGNSKRLLKLGTFSNGTEASFLLTVKRTDGLGFTGYLTINSNASYSTNITQFNGYKSSYSLYDITNGELADIMKQSCKCQLFKVCHGHSQPSAEDLGN